MSILIILIRQMDLNNGDAAKQLNSEIAKDEMGRRDFPSTYIARLHEC
jgi:hypothetical protein